MYILYNVEIYKMRKQLVLRECITSICIKFFAYLVEIAQSVASFSPSDAWLLPLFQSVWKLSV